MHDPAAPEAATMGVSDISDDRYNLDDDLDDLLGIDRTDPRIAALEHDKSEYKLLVNGLVALRKQHGMTQAAVAEQMETTQSVISAFEQAVTDARFSTVQRYARAVGARLYCWHSITGGRQFKVQTASNADSDLFYASATASR